MCSFKLSTSKQSISPFKELPRTPQSYQPTLVDKAKGWFKLNSFGGRLFWMIMLGALAGMGGMAFLFSEMLRRQAEDQVRSSIDSKVNAIASVTDSAETLAYSLGVSATTLHERGAQFPDTYRELVLQLFQRRPEFVVGLGLGQSKNGILEEQPWLFPYYSAITSAESTSFDPDAIRYEDFADDVGEFYPDTDRYRDYFEPQTSVWTEPYQGDRNRLLTYYYPLFNSDGRWLGTSLVEIDSAYLGNLLDDVVFQQAGYFLLLTQSGQVIADPTNPTAEAQTYQTIPELEAIWPQIDTEAPGFLKTASGYWAYATVPGQDWLLFGFVPYKAIYGRILRIAAVTTGLMVLLLAVVVYLAIRKLNQRIKPILLQGKQFVGTHGNLLEEVAIAQKDELEQLSVSFFNILNQLNMHQETIRRHEETITQSYFHADQLTEKFLAFTAQVDEEAREQQALIQKVQQQLDEQSNQYQSIDRRLDALFSLAQTLGGYLESMPSESEANQIFDILDQRIMALTGSVNQSAQSADKSQFQALIAQLIADVTNLKAYDRQRHSLEKLHHQTSNLTQSRQATIANSQAMATAAQTIAQILTEIDAITDTLNRDAKQVSEMLWGDLQQGSLKLPGQPGILAQSQETALPPAIDPLATEHYGVENSWPEGTVNAVEKAG
ncbi:Cache domain-containing protein [Leptolyngbya sp. PCC 7375]|nr:Cache domain-containing protein [Leptolyngbya sp. PCC 7375]